MENSNAFEGGKKRERQPGIGKANCAMRIKLYVQMTHYESTYLPDLHPSCETASKIYTILWKELSWETGKKSWRACSWIDIIKAFVLFSSPETLVRLCLQTRFLLNPLTDGCAFCFQWKNRLIWIWVACRIPCHSTTISFTCVGVLWRTRYSIHV